MLKRSLDISLCLFLVFFPLQHVHANYTELDNNDEFSFIRCISKSDDSDYYMKNCKQYHLWNLKTEGLHNKTMDLSKSLRIDTLDGVKKLISVDRDIVVALKRVANTESDLNKLEALSESIEKTILGGGKVYIYGCGSTGRLAKQLAFIWKNFWINFIAQNKTASDKTKKLNYVSSGFVGIITGGDRALISSIEGFEDVPLIGALQIDDHNFSEQDMIIGVSEGGETSSVIGATLEAAKRLNPKERSKKAFFIFNNDEKDLIHLKRSKSIIDNSGITKISLATGEQAITGSTRMQATTTSTFVLGVAMEKASFNILKNLGYTKEILYLGFPTQYSIKDRLQSFEKIYNKLSDSAPEISKIVDIEYDVYKKGKKVIYTGLSSIVTLFSDITERSPTFSIKAIDTDYSGENNSIIKVLVLEGDLESAWKKLLNDQFTGLNKEKYSTKLSQSTDLPKKLKDLAISGLHNAENRQKYYYDFSYKNFLKTKDLQNIGHVFVYLLQEDFKNPNIAALSDLLSFLDIKNIPYTILNLSNIDLPFKTNDNLSNVIKVSVSGIEDAIGLNTRILLKTILNTQSTSVMAKSGYVLGNFMTNLKPANLKLIGRATNIIRSVVNHKVPSAMVSHADANVVLFEAIEFKKSDMSNHSEISLSIVRLLESLKLKRCISFKEADFILSDLGLEIYLEQYDK